MLNIDSLLVEDFYNENKDFFVNARIQKIQQPTRREVILLLRNNAESKKFYININPEFYHLCFMSKENEQKRDIQIPKHPPMFCMLLRKHLEGARILSVHKPDFERIIELNIENYNELGDKIEECLSIELMGKHSNIILYNTDNNIILGCAHNVGAEKSKERELSGGLPYIYPPKQDKKNLLMTRSDYFLSYLKKSALPLKKALADRYFCLSQAVCEDICSLHGIDPLQTASNLDENSTKILFVALHEFLAQQKRNYSLAADFSKYSCVNSLDLPYDSVNELIDDYFAYNTEKSLVSALKSSLKTRLLKDIKRYENTLANQQKQLDKKDKALDYMKKGSLLTANAYKIKKGEKSVTLEDYETGTGIQIQLDENLSPIENAQRYFKLYNKIKRACDIAQKMAQETGGQILFNKQLLYDVENTDSLEELKEISAELEPEIKQSPSKKKELKLNITKLDIDGFCVYIGKNNKQNDYLYSKISSPEDVWFHTLNTPGSHVIVKTPEVKRELKDETVLKIAKLAKEYSTAKNSTKIPVVYTLRKYIKRPNNTKSGFVVYKNETEIVVD